MSFRANLEKAPWKAVRRSLRQQAQHCLVFFAFWLLCFLGRTDKSTQPAPNIKQRSKKKFQDSSAVFCPAFAL